MIVSKFPIFALLLLIIVYSKPTLAKTETGVPSSRPNIIVVLVDDMGFSDIGCYGGEIDTPHLDQLAADGLRFTQFYNSGRCCPTRASLLTGLHPHQVGIGHMTAPPNQPLGFEGPYQGYLNDRCTTLAEVLKSSGYHTLMTGKWHLGLQSQSTWPLQRGFDQFYGGLSGAFNYFEPGGDRKLTRGNEPVETDNSFYATDTFTDEACRFIENATRENDAPFFLYLAYNAPHWPLQPKLADYEKYRGKYSDGWETLMKSRLRKQQEIGLFTDEITPAPHVGPTWNSLSDDERDRLDAVMAAYAGCVDSIDQNIGKLVSFLKRQDLYDNTLILFLSDNGACQEGGDLGKGGDDWARDSPKKTVNGIRVGLAWANASNTPFRLYKHFVHEGGACTPMIAHWPAGIPTQDRGQFVRQHAYLPDCMATCIELSGANYPDSIPACEGKSLVATLKGKRAAIHEDPIYWEHEGNAAMRWGSWKLVREYQKPWELYDLRKDRTEMNDLANSERKQRDQMIEMWEQWATETEVAYPKRFNMYEFLRKKNAKPKNKSSTQ